MEMEVVQLAPHFETADHQENGQNNVKNVGLSENLTVVNLINNSIVDNEVELNGTELQSDSFEMVLRQSSDESNESVTATQQESIENIDISSANLIINQNSQPKLSNIFDSEHENVLLETELQDSPVKISQRKRLQIIDSNSEGEKNDCAIRKPFKLIDSESEVSLCDDESPVKRKLIDSGSESRNSDDSNNVKSDKKVKKLKRRKDHKTTNLRPIDSDEDNDSDDKRQHQRDVIERVNEKEMIAIKSESQRTIREHTVEISSHKPRAFTLKEFLDRKTVVKPSALIKQQVKAFKSNGNIKMNRDELKFFARKIELRKRDIRSFLKNHTIEKTKVITSVVKSLEKVKSLPIDPMVLEVSPTSTGDLNKENVINELNTPLETNTVTVPETKSKKQEKIAHLSSIKSEVRLSFNYDENSFIDLESGNVVSKKIESKAEQFMNRVLKHMTAGKKKSTDENEELKRLIDCDQEYKMDIKPRGSYIKLKKQLKERIMEEKKIKFKLQEQELNDKADNEEEEMEEYNEKLEQDEDDEMKDENVDIYEEGEVYGLIETRDEEEKDVDYDDEQEDDELNCNQEQSKGVSEVEEASEIDEENNKKTKTFSRIKQMDDLESSDNDDNTEHNVENQLELLDDDKLFSEDVVDGLDVEEELLGLCSGRFDTQLPATISHTMSSLAPATLKDLSSILLPSAKDGNDITGDEDDDRIGAKKNRKSRKIVLSDDETAELVEPLENDEVDDEETERIDQPTVYDEEEEEMIITYDSDENDVALTVDDYEKTKKMKIQNFFENEAELSESDWNSEDEDEKGVDNYDIELGDEDQFDAQKLKSELAQIHMRRMLNDDEREVQLIQDLIMPEQEDNELRERKFRWKNLDNPFGADGQNSAETAELNENQSEDESEEFHRKLRFERETLLQSQPDDLDPACILIKTDSQDLNKPKVITKRLSIIKTERNKTPTSSTEPSFLIGTKNSPLITKFRDSFLARGEQHLSSLEQLTIEKLDKCASIETAITTEKSSKLFFVIDEEAKAKRKSDETLESTGKRKKIS